MERLIFIPNPGFVRENAGLVGEDFLNFHFKICEFHPLGRAIARLPNFLGKTHAKVKVKMHDNRLFGYAILAAIVNSDRAANRPAHYDDLFESKNLLHLLPSPSLSICAC